MKGGQEDVASAPTGRVYRRGLRDGAGAAVALLHHAGGQERRGSLLRQRAAAFQAHVGIGAVPSARSETGAGGSAPSSVRQRKGVRSIDRSARRTPCRRGGRSRDGLAA